MQCIRIIPHNSSKGITTKKLSRSSKILKVDKECVLISDGHLKNFVISLSVEGMPVSN